MQLLTRDRDQQDRIIFFVVERFFALKTGEPADRSPLHQSSSDDGPVSTKSTRTRTRSALRDASPRKLDDIAHAANNRWPGLGVTREDIYRLVAAAIERGILSYQAPHHQVLAQQLRIIAPVGPNASIDVIGVDREYAPDRVSARGAEITLERIRELARRKNGNRPVHIGLGVGRTTTRLARQLANMLNNETGLPKLIFHALSPPFSQWDTLEMPVAFYSYLYDAFSRFSDPHEHIDFVGLFASPVVDVGVYDHVVQDEQPVRRAFEAAKDIDIVVTSLAWREDRHGLLTQYLDAYDTNQTTKQLLESQGWIGDVLSRPFSKNGPINIQEGMKPISIYELDGLAEFAKREDKHVVMVVGPCGRCGRSKAPALLPLLTQPSLRLWNHLIVDAKTAHDVLQLHTSHPVLDQLPTELA